MKIKYVKSKYKGVCHHSTIGSGNSSLSGFKRKWRTEIMNNNIRWIAYFKTEREAALAYDKKRIEFGLEPVNILKRKL